MLWILLGILTLATISSFVIGYEDAVVAYGIMWALVLVALVSCIGVCNSVKNNSR